MTLSGRIQSLRVARHMSLQGLADRAGISKTHVWDLERQDDVNPTLSTIYALANALGISVVELLGLEGAQPNLHPEAMRIAREIDQLLQKEPIIPAEASGCAAEDLRHVESEARRYAGFYAEGSDGRNTFVIFADMVADRLAARASSSGEAGDE